MRNTAVEEVKKKKISNEKEERNLGEERHNEGRECGSGEGTA